MKNKISVEGRFRIQLQNEDGSIFFDSGDQKNLIVNGAMGYSKFPPQGIDYLCLGAGVVTEPAVTDTQLGNQVAAERINFTAHSGTDEGDYFATKSSTIVNFTNLDYTLTELGIRTGGTGGTLITRALIRDDLGNASSVTVLPSQTLKLTYSIHYKFPRKITEGVMTTTFGDLNWELSIYGTTANSVASSARYDWGFYIYDTAKVAGITVSDGSSTSDVSTQTAILTGTLPAQENDIVLNTGAVILQPAIITDTTYQIKLTASFTIPKNHIFTISAEVYWGRLA
jgi:hypothetical protein